MLPEGYLKYIDAHRPQLSKVAFYLCIQMLMYTRNRGFPTAMVREWQFFPFPRGTVRTLVCSFFFLDKKKNIRLVVQMSAALPFFSLFSNESRREGYLR